MLSVAAAAEQMRGLFDKIAQVLGWLDVAEFAIPAKCQKVSKRCLTFYICKLEVGQIPELESVARLNILRPAINLGEILVPEEHSARERGL